MIDFKKDFLDYISVVRLPEALKALQQGARFRKVEEKLQQVELLIRYHIVKAFV